MSDAMPKFPPLMLRWLTYAEALQSMRHTGCAIRRQHWCSPVVVYEGTRLIFDNEDQRDPWKPTREDRKARDWEMVPNPADHSAAVAVAEPCEATCADGQDRDEQNPPRNLEREG